MKEKYGQTVIDELRKQDREIKQFKVFMLKEEFEKFSIIYKALEQEAKYEN